MLLHYDDILTFDVKENFTKHFLALGQCQTLEEFNKKKSTLVFAPEIKARIADCYKLLRENNWLPIGAKRGFNEKLEIKFARCDNFVPPEKEEIKPDWQDSRALHVKAQKDKERFAIIHRIQSGEISYEEGTRQMEELK